MSHLIRTIVQNYIENSNCFDIVAKDGITTDQFAIYKSDLLFEKASLDVRQVQLQIPAILRSVSIAKNLDYYQNKICHENTLYSRYRAGQTNITKTTCDNNCIVSKVK
jgi:hypothetical protein